MVNMAVNKGKMKRKGYTSKLALCWSLLSIICTKVITQFIKDIDNYTKPSFPITQGEYRL